jgi:hypothetical protein
MPRNGARTPSGVREPKITVHAPPRGAAYDSKHGLRRPTRRLGYDAAPPEAVNVVHKLASWCIANLDREAQLQLCEYLTNQPADYDGAAQDGESVASLDPYDTRAKPPTNAYGKTPKPGMDSAYERKMASLEERYPGISRIGFA